MRIVLFLGSIPIPDAIYQHSDPGRVFIQAGDHCEELTSRGKKLFSAFHFDFFECLEAVRDERWADNCDAFDALFGKGLQNVIGERAQPRLPGQARLE